MENFNLYDNDNYILIYMLIAIVIGLICSFLLTLVIKSLSKALENKDLKENKNDK